METLCLSVWGRILLKICSDLLIFMDIRPQNQLPRCGCHIYSESFGGQVCKQMSTVGHVIMASCPSSNSFEFWMEFGLSLRSQEIPTPSDSCFSRARLKCCLFLLATAETTSGEPDRALPTTMYPPEAQLLLVDCLTGIKEQTMQ